MNLPDPTDRLAPTSETPRAEPAWMKFAGVFENDADFAEIMDELRAERESDDDSEVDPAVYMSTPKVVPMEQDNFWAEVMATIQAEKDAMGDEEIDPAYYMPRESGDDS
jgi:hypothetical protein